MVYARLLRLSATDVLFASKEIFYVYTHKPSNGNSNTNIDR